MRICGDRETSSAFQRVDFDESALINFFVGSASRRVGGSYRRSASVLRWQCVVDDLRRQCVALRRVASAVRRVGVGTVSAAGVGIHRR